MEVGGFECQWGAMVGRQFLDDPHVLGETVLCWYAGHDSQLIHSRRWDKVLLANIRMY